MIVATAPTLAATGTTQIVQQRLSDGRILLTDHPVRGATTERSWQMTTDDPVAARQRAATVSAEAQQVSERIQKMIDQNRRADIELEQTRLAALAMARQSMRDDEPVYYGGVGGYGYGYGAGLGLGLGLGKHGRDRVDHHHNRWGTTERFGTVGRYGAGSAPGAMPHPRR